VSDQEAKGVFINGREQVIELLQFLPANEREKLLNNIKKRNPALANELQRKTISFSDIDNLSDYEIRLIIQNTKAQILGLALKDTPTNTQRRILSLAERTYAESAFEIMTTPLSNEHIDSKRAKDKIKSIIVQIIKRRQANLIS